MICLNLLFYTGFSFFSILRYRIIKQKGNFPTVTDSLT